MTSNKFILNVKGQHYALRIHRTENAGKSWSISDDGKDIYVDGEFASKLTQSQLLVFRRYIGAEAVNRQIEKSGQELPALTYTDVALVAAVAFTVTQHAMATAVIGAMASLCKWTLDNYPRKNQKTINTVDYVTDCKISRTVIKETIRKTFEAVDKPYKSVLAEIDRISAQTAGRSVA